MRKCLFQKSSKGRTVGVPAILGGGRARPQKPLNGFGVSEAPRVQPSGSRFPRRELPRKSVLQQSVTLTHTAFVPSRGTSLHQKGTASQAEDVLKKYSPSNHDQRSPAIYPVDTPPWRVFPRSPRSVLCRGPVGSKLGCAVCSAAFVLQAHGGRRWESQLKGPSPREEYQRRSQKVSAEQ